MRARCPENSNKLTDTIDSIAEGEKKPLDTFTVLRLFTKGTHIARKKNVIIQHAIQAHSHREQKRKAT